jgi:cell division protein FtsZ
MNAIRAYASPDAHVIYGTAYDDSLGDEIRVTVVATGLSRKSKQQVPLHVLRTGTDNTPFQIPTLSNQVAGQAIASAGAAPQMAGQPDYGSMATPSIWRNNRTQAAARVDALSSGGMDDYDIPAFLRKQAD